MQNYEELCCYNCLSRLLLGMNVKLLGGTFYILTSSKNSRSTFLLKSFSSLKTLSKASFSFLKFAIKNTQCMQYSHERSKITIYTMSVNENTIWSQNELASIYIHAYVSIFAFSCTTPYFKKISFFVCDAFTYFNFVSVFPR